MSTLFLLRHLKSQWNEEENRFTGWVDVPLEEKQQKKAKELAKKIFREKIDTIYCSPLFRNMDTVAEILEYDEKYPIFIHLDPERKKKWRKFKDISQKDIPVYVSEKLNERYYGKLQGFDKKETIKKYGKEKVKEWRRSYEIMPPDGERLKDVFKRAVPFYKKYIEKDLTKGENVLIVASHNPLRTIVKYIENISDKKIIDLEIPFAGLIKYEFDKKLNLLKKENL